MFFQGWADVYRTLVVGLLSYAGLVLFLRLSGKRTLSKLNAFDLVITVALGSTLATILLSTQVTLVEGLTAFLMLIGMQYVVASLQSRSTSFQKLVKAEPRLLYYRGQFLERALADERVAHAECLQAVRSAGHASLESIEAIVLETDGSFAVVTSSQNNGSAMENVDRQDTDPS